MEEKEITEAISMHGRWKIKLRSAITYGHDEMPIDVVKADNQCEFGKWLYGPAISAQDKSSENYKKVKELHARFHMLSAGLMSDALCGKQAEVLGRMSFGSEYYSVSAELVSALMKWISG